MIETSLGDLVLVLTQQPLVRWGLALGASLWVWLIGDAHARLRVFYLLAPFVVAALIEISEFAIVGGASGRLSQLLVVQEAARQIASPIGFSAIALAVVLGFMRGIGFAIGVAVLLCAYFVRGGGGGTVETGTQFLMLLPTVLLVLLAAYGIGATIRRFREPRRYDDHRDRRYHDERRHHDD